MIEQIFKDDQGLTMEFFLAKQIKPEMSSMKIQFVCKKLNATNDLILINLGSFVYVESTFKYKSFEKSEKIEDKKRLLRISMEEQFLEKIEEVDEIPSLEDIEIPLNEDTSQS